MTIQQFLFILIAAVSLSAAVMAVTVRNMVHAALWLIACLGGIAVFFAILSAGFLAVAQVVIYIGAIAILMIFAIMLTRNVVSPSSRAFNSGWFGALIVAVVMFVLLVLMLSQWPVLKNVTQAPALPSNYDPVRLLGLALVSPNGYVLPFELASILLLAALIGSIMVAWGRK